MWDSETCRPQFGVFWIKKRDYLTPNHINLDRCLSQSWSRWAFVGKLFQKSRRKTFFTTCLGAGAGCRRHVFFQLICCFVFPLGRSLSLSINANNTLRFLTKSFCVQPYISEKVTMGMLQITRTTPIMSG